MTVIRLTTTIHAPIEACFDLARSIDLHQYSTRHTQEVAIAGRTQGLIEKDEYVTWRAVHFGIRQTLTSKIFSLERPYYFEDVMVHGAFKSMRHEHHFTRSGNNTFMIDHFEY